AGGRDHVASGGFGAPYDAGSNCGEGYRDLRRGPHHATYELQPPRSLTQMAPSSAAISAAVHLHRCIRCDSPSSDIRFRICLRNGNHWSMQQRAVTAYHTNVAKYSSTVREVFHDRSDCPSGSAINLEDREKGTGGNRRCRECIRLEFRP